jgi:hypothetical protein
LRTMQQLSGGTSGRAAAALPATMPDSRAREFIVE